MSYALIFFIIDYQNQLANFESIHQLLLVYTFILCDSTGINLHDDNREYNYFLFNILMIKNIIHIFYIFAEVAKEMKIFTQVDHWYVFRMDKVTEFSYL